MTAMALNPVERRLLYLCDHWSRFTADPSKRLLVWQVQDNALRILQCFFEVQKHETEYSTRDLFIVFDAPFENSIQYSRALKEALAGQYDASREDLRQQGIAPDWTFTPGDVAHSARGFVEGLRSFGSRHHGAIGHLVAVLMPSNVSPDAHDAFGDWLARALENALPERLRLAVVDSTDTPRLQKLVASDHPLVLADAPDIDALQTAQETFAQEAAVGPAAIFRNLLMGLVTLVDRAPADQVKAKAADAVAFARKQGWGDQEVVIAVLVAGALLKEQRFDEALNVNAHARETAQKTAAAGHPAGRQLVLQTWFGEAGTHFAAGDALRAADAYREAAILAQSVPNLVLAIEALRMEAFCRARAGNTEAAIETGHAALSVGARLKPDARPMTTLPIAALDLLRVLDPRRVSLMEDIKSRLTARELEAQEAAERRAAELEGVQDPRAFQQAETELTGQLDAAGHEAGEAVRAVVLGSEPRFAEVFASAQALLGPQWPLATLSAVPMPAVAQHA
jgi:hypothetical protein